MVRIRLSPRSMKRYSHVKRRQSIRVKQTIRCNLDHFAFPLLPRPTTASQDAAAMAKTKVSQLPQPPHDRFTALLRELEIPLAKDIPSMRRYLPIIFNRFIEAWCDEL
jgi:hypothetical protein